MAVVSIDLARRRYADNGLALLGILDRRIRCEFRRIEEDLTGEPSAPELADYLIELASSTGSECILIDGPQAWKSPSNGHVHQRDCEKILYTPGKTGEPGVVKPASWTSFVELSVALFDALHDRGWVRLGELPRDDGEYRHLAIESFPTAAWRALRLKPLPGKSNCPESEIQSHLDALMRIFPLDLSRRPSHDELQALVAGIGGVALESSRTEFLQVVGRPPEPEDGVWREGFIVNPTLPPHVSRVRRIGPQLDPAGEGLE